MGEGLQLVTQSSHPSPRTRLLFQSIPVTRHIHLVTAFPQGKRRVTQVDARHRAVEIPNQHPEPLWRVLSCCCNRLNSGLAKFRKEQIGDEVSGRFRGGRRKPHPLSVQMRHGLDSVLLRLELCSQRSEQVIPEAWLAVVGNSHLKSRSPVGRQ